MTPRYALLITARDTGRDAHDGQQREIRGCAAWQLGRACRCRRRASSIIVCGGAEPGAGLDPETGDVVFGDPEAPGSYGKDLAAVEKFLDKGWRRPRRKG